MLKSFANILQKLNMGLLFLFVIELFMAFSNVDLIPLFLIAIISGLILFLRRNESFESSEEYSDTKGVITFVLSGILIGLIFVFLLYYGIENIGAYILNLLNINKLFRFVLYGLIFPFVLSYFITWLWLDEKPIQIQNKYINCLTFPKVLLATLILGVLVCIYWEGYLGVASRVIGIF